MEGEASLRREGAARPPQGDGEPPFAVGGHGKGLFREIVDGGASGAGERGGGNKGEGEKGATHGGKRDAQAREGPAHRWMGRSV